MDQQSRNSAIDAAVILLGFGLVAYFMPAIMLAVGKWSTAAAALVAVAFVAAFFVVFWLRGRAKGG